MEEKNTWKAVKFGMVQDGSALIASASPPNPKPGQALEGLQNRDSTTDRRSAATVTSAQLPVATESHHPQLSWQNLRLAKLSNLELIQFDTSTGDCKVRPTPKSMTFRCQLQHPDIAKIPSTCRCPHSD